MQEERSLSKGPSVLHRDRKSRFAAGRGKTSTTEKLKKELLKLRLERKLRGDDHEEAPEEVEEEGKNEVEVDQEEDQEAQEAAQEGARADLTPFLFSTVIASGDPMDFFGEFERLSLEIRTSHGRTLLIADPHIGFELSRGLRVRTRFEERLAEFIVKRDPDLLILLGDVKEPIGLSFTVKRLLMGFFSELRGIPTVITKGNHDGRIEEVAERFSHVRVVDHLLAEGKLFLHGHTGLPEGDFEEAYLGHIHPAYTFKGAGASRKTKVFLRVGRFLILPTVNPFIEGFDVREGIKMIPFLRDSKEGEAFLPEGIYLGKIPL